MFKTQCVLGLIALIVEFAHPWDFAVSHEDLLEFYTNETQVDTIRIPFHNLAALTYNEVQNMMLYIDKQNNNDSVCAVDISSKVNQCLIERNGRNIHGLTFDPATELVFFTDTNERTINWIALKTGSSKYGNLLIKMDDGTPTDLAVDSCRGYVYWINTNLTTPTIERARFNGSDRKVIVNLTSVSTNTTFRLEPHSLTIDQQTQKMYWIEPINASYYQIYYSDLNGKNKTWLNFINFYPQIISSNPPSNTLAVTKTNIFWLNCRLSNKNIVWKLGKIVWMGTNSTQLLTKTVVGIVANYKIKEQIQDNHDCEALKCVERRISDGPFCVNGMKVVGKSLCKCASGYIGERCDVSVCENYCLHGSCTLNIEGLPNCSCHVDYSGARCEVDACRGFCQNDGICSLNEQREPVCQCRGHHAGDRCEVSGCVNYCLQGNCTINSQGLPKCSCEAGYSGERCEVDMCHGHCLNSGACYINEEDEPNCECSSGFDGPRCEAVPITFTLPSNAFSAETTSNLAGGYNLTVVKL